MTIQPLQVLKDLQPGSLANVRQRGCQTDRSSQHLAI